MFGLMLFMFFFFLGISAWMWHISRRLSAQFRQLGDEHAQLRVLMRAMESRLDAILSENRGEESTLQNNNAGDPEAAHDPLLHLSFEEPQRMDKNAPLDPALDINFEPDQVGESRGGSSA